MEILWILLLMLILILAGVPVFASLGISSVVALLLAGLFFVPSFPYVFRTNRPVVKNRPLLPVVTPWDRWRGWKEIQVFSMVSKIYTSVLLFFQQYYIMIMLG